MSPSFTRDRETWLSYFLMAFYGYLLNILGPLTPFLRMELAISYTLAGFHFSSFAVGVLLAGLGGERVQRKFGYHNTLRISALGMAGGTLLLVSARAIWLTLPAAFLMGLLGSLILVLIPPMLSLKYKAHSGVALTELNVVASLAGMTSPLLVGFFAGRWLGWRAALWLVIAGLVLLVAIFFRQRQPAPTRNAEGGNAPPNAGGLTPRYWVYWLVIFLVVSVEFCLLFWGSDYLIQKVGMPLEDAAGSLTFFLGAMLLGRWLGSRFLRIYSAARLFRIALPLAALGFFLFWLAATPAPA